MAKDPIDRYPSAGDLGRAAVAATRGEAVTEPEHVVGAGIGYKTGRYHADLAWQWEIPNRDSVGTSKLLTGEYSHSSTETSVQWLAFTTGVEF